MSHRALSQGENGQFDLARDLGLHPSLGGARVPDILHGRAVRHIMAQADIRQTKKIGEERTGGGVGPYLADKLVEAPNYQSHRAYRQGTRLERGYSDEELWTSQSHLHLPTLTRYAQGNVPKFDPDYYEPESDYPEETEVPYEPETYHYGGKRWISEGHHRTVAQRLAR